MSPSRLMRSFIPCLATSALFAGGCAGVPRAVQVRYADVAVPTQAGQLSRQAVARALGGGRPVVLEFQPGDHLPVELSIAGQGFALVPEHPPLELVAKQRMYLRIWKDGLKTSLDPQGFDRKPKKPGTFRLGFWLARGQPAKLDIAVTEPERASPAR